MEKILNQRRYTLLRFQVSFKSNEVLDRLTYNVRDIRVKVFYAQCLDAIVDHCISA